MRRASLLIALLPACFAGQSGPQSPFVRVMADDGRVYYADLRRAFHTKSGGFLTFRCLVTGDSVRLQDGTYRALECPKVEVDTRQRQYLRDPSKKPHADDYEPEPER